MRNYTLLVFTDGRGDLLEKTLESAGRELLFDGLITPIIIDDSGDPDYANHLEHTYRRFGQIHHDHRLGFCATVADAWTHVPPSTDFVFHLEDDFVFERRINIGHLADVLDENPKLAQITLMRQAWNPEEVAAGGVIALQPDAFTDHHDDQDRYWLEHRLYFSTNPSIYRRSLTKAGWPVDARCEGLFSHQLLADPDLIFGVWGARTDDPWVTHIGEHRVGTGY
jgi:hypothetical protein